MAKSVADVTDNSVEADGRRATNDGPNGEFDYIGPAIPNPGRGSDAAVNRVAKVIHQKDFAKNGGEF